MATATATGTRLDLYRSLARQLRADSIRCSTAAGSGHPTSSLSAADLMAVLLAGHLRYDFERPDSLANDHLIFSKGHASPLVYAMFRAEGAIDDAELMTFRKFGSRLEGHPTPILPWVDVASGSRLPASGCCVRHSTCGLSSVTANRPRARSGKPSISPATKASRMSPRS